MSSEKSCETPPQENETKDNNENIAENIEQIVAGGEETKKENGREKKSSLSSTDSEDEDEKLSMKDSIVKKLVVPEKEEDQAKEKSSNEAQEIPQKDEEKPKSDEKTEKQDEEKDVVVINDVEEKQTFKPKPPETPPTSPRRTRSKQNDDEPLTDEEVMQYRDQALRNVPIRGLSDMQYEQIMDELVNERNETVKTNNFEESDRFNAAYELVQRCMIERQKNEAVSESVKQYEEQLKAAKDLVKQFDEETEAQLKALKEAKANQMAAINENHENQLDKHTLEWTSDKKVRQYNRASHTLINLRKQFKLLVQQCRFKEAGEVQKIIATHEAHEKEEAHLQMQRDFDESLRKLQARQEKEKETYRSQAAVQIEQLKQKRARLRVAVINRLNKVEKIGETAKDPEKVWNSLQMQRKEEMATARSAGLSAQVTTKVNVQTADTKEDAMIELPPLVIKRPLRNQTPQKTNRSTN